MKHHSCSQRLPTGSWALALILALAAIPFWPAVSLAQAATPAAEPETAMYVLSIARLGGFLQEPEKEPTEFFRRVGRVVLGQSNLFADDQLRMAGFYGSSFALGNLFQDRLFARDWSGPQKKAVEQLLAQAEPVLATLAGGLPAAKEGLSFRGVFDPKGLVGPLASALESGKIPEGLRQSQVFKLRNRVLPVLQVADLIVFAGILSHEGLEFRVQMLGGPMYKENLQETGGPPAPLTTVKYVSPDSLVTFAQVHMGQTAAGLMQSLREFPQTKTVECFLASAGLDLEKDILDNPGKETVVSINLTPRGEGGIPDLQGFARVKDPLKLLTIAPNLKQLAMSLGIFVAPFLDAPPSFRLSYFMAPQIGVHVAMRGELLLFATHRDLMVELVKRMDEIDTGRLAAFPVPAGVHRYWRIAFSRLNEQLQQFLQSPLLTGKDIPPVPNLDVAGELGNLEFLTRILPDKVDISISLPMARK
ncbi:MAG: hypothetical protein GX442_03070 [Candidatus Riflebacteria bacterium]|nr:hypothetical protein [Candidatus Riflebacteria bacterium]